MNTATAMDVPAQDDQNFLRTLASTAFFLTFGSHALLLIGLAGRFYIITNRPIPAPVFIALGVLTLSALLVLLLPADKRAKAQPWLSQILLLTGMFVGIFNSGVMAVTLFNIPLLTVFGFVFFPRKTAMLQLGVLLLCLSGITAAKLLDLLPPIPDSYFLVNSDYRWVLRFGYFFVGACALLIFMDRYVHHSRRAVNKLHVLKESVDESQQAFVIWDNDDRLFMCNKAFNNLEPKLSPYLTPGVSFADTLIKGLELGMYPEAEGAVEQWLAKRLALHQNEKSTQTLRLADGRWINVQESRTPTGYIAGFRTDVTQLQHAEELLTTTLDTVDEAILTLTATGGVEYMNIAAANMFQIDRNEVIGRSINGFYNPLGTQFLKQLLEKQQDRPGLPVHASSRQLLYRVNRSSFPAEIQLTTVPWASDTIVVATIKDLSAKKVYDGKNEALGAALEQLDIGFALFDDASSISFMNQRFTTLFTEATGAIQIKEGDHVTTVFESIARMCPSLKVSNDRTSATRGFLKFYYDLEGTLKVRTGDQILELSGQRLAGDYVSLRLADITEATKQAAELEQATKLATLGEMATGIAHEVNQPLQAIKLTAATAKQRLEQSPENVASISQKLTQILQQVDRAATITDHMRHSARVASETDAQSDISEVVANAHLLLKSTLELKQIDWRVSLPLNIPKCAIHPIRLEQVLVNLVNNSIDALSTPRGTNSEKWVSIWAEVSEPSKVNLWVEDSAGGMPDAILNRVFDPFFTTKPPGQGTGLGLSISYRIIANAHGEISVANTEHGARFSVKLPIASNT